MLRSSSSCGVKIVKSSSKPPGQVSVQDAQVASVCEPLSVVPDEDFLETVDNDILFEDGSIVLQEKAASKESLQAHEETENQSKIEEERPEQNELPSEKFKFQPTPLSSQIQLPLRDIESLSFYEVLMLSHVLSAPSSRLVPKPDDIDQVGSASLMAEEDSDGNLCVYMMSQVLLDNAQMSYEVLSVVDKNLKLIHEKMIEKSCEDGHATVAYMKFYSNLNLIFVSFRRNLCTLSPTPMGTSECSNLRRKMETRKAGRAMSSGESLESCCRTPQMC